MIRAASQTVAAVVIAIAFYATAAPAPSPPNIVWLVAEDLSPIIPPFGDGTVATPNLTRLADDAAKRQDHRATIKYAQHIFDVEPSDETAQRLQMEAYLALDDKAAALRSYHRYADTLERDLAVEPGEAIEELYH